VSLAHSHVIALWWLCNIKSKIYKDLKNSKRRILCKPF
jgi:nitrogen fixation-related uncharacterized protein